MLLPKYLTLPETHTEQKTKGALPMHKKYSIPILTTREVVGGQIPQPPHHGSRPNI